MPVLSEAWQCLSLLSREEQPVPRFVLLEVPWGHYRTVTNVLELGGVVVDPVTSEFGLL